MDELAAITNVIGIDDSRLIKLTRENKYQLLTDVKHGDYIYAMDSVCFYKYRGMSGTNEGSDWRLLWPDDKEVVHNNLIERFKHIEPRF